MTGFDNRPQRKLTDRERAEIKNQHHSWLAHIAVSAIDGMLIGLAIGLMIIWLDLKGIGSMLAHSDHQAGFTLLLLGGLAHTFGMVSAGMSIWLKATQEEKS